MQLRRYLLILALSPLGFYHVGGGFAEEGRTTSRASEVGGVARKGEASWNPEEVFEGHWATVCATAYSPVDPIDGTYHASKGEKWRWIAADGRTDVRDDPYGIAVPLDGGRRPHFRFGTRFYIPKETGYVSRTVENRVFEVDDVGNGKEYFKYKRGCLHIDLRFKTHESAIAWAGADGYRFIKVFFIKRDRKQAPKPAVILTAPVPLIPCILPPKIPLEWLNLK